MKEQVSLFNFSVLGLAYIAGFLDADGSVVISKSTDSRTSGGYGYQLHVNIGQKIMLPLFEELIKAYGGSVCHTNRNSYMWTICSKKAMTFLQDILPYLRLKQEEAKLGIQFQTKVKNYCGHVGHLLSDSELMKREIFYQEMRRLKKERKPL